MAATTNAAPPVTIGLPTYNGARFLARTLDDWLAQDFPDFELVVSDNGSTDETRDILADYLRRDARIRVSRLTATLPVSQNFNRLVAEARAPLFAWSADDDRHEPDFLSSLVPALKDPEVVLAYPRVQFLRSGEESPSGRIYYAVDPPGSEAEPLRRAIGLLRRARSWAMIYGLIRTESLRRTQLLHSPMGLVSDVGVMLELSTLGRFVCVPKVLLMPRVHARSASARQDDPMYAGGAGKLLDERTREYVEAFPLPPRECQLLLDELDIWCRKGRKPRPLWMRVPGLRWAWVRAGRAWVDRRVAASVR